jgi:hypothetical protein
MPASALYVEKSMQWHGLQLVLYVRQEAVGTDKKILGQSLKSKI